MKRDFEVLSKHLCSRNEQTEENPRNPRPLVSRFKFETSCIRGAMFETHLTLRFVGVLDFLHK